MSAPPTLTASAANDLLSAIQAVIDQNWSLNTPKTVALLMRAHGFEFPGHTDYFQKLDSGYFQSPEFLLR